MTPDQIAQYALEIAEAAVRKASRDLDRWIDLSDEDHDAVAKVLELIAENIATHAAEAVTTRG
jgi:hypothetical protein